MDFFNKNCSHDKLIVIDKQETYTIKGEKITIEARVKRCEMCNEEIFDINLDTENLKKAYVKYKKAHSLMQSDEILALRKNYNLSQNMLALLIGCTQATIARYERGSIQSETHNTALELLKEPLNLKKIFEMKKNNFNDNERKILENILNKNNNVEEKSISLLENLYNYSPDVYSGFNKFHFNKFIAVIIFFALKQTNLYKTKLMKLLWYADMLYFKENTVSITGMKYIHQQYGPVPDNHAICLGIIDSLGIIELKEQDIGEIVITKKTDSFLNCLSKSELDALNRINSHFLHSTAKEISITSHNEKGYKETLPLNFISYEYAFDLKNF